MTRALYRRWFGWCLAIALVGISGSAHAWPMAGADPQRRSWVAEEVGGNFSIEWYRPIEPYISQNVQIIAADGRLYVSTARGLYALDAASGNTVWVYPTASPLGHSPTFHNGVLYVGGFDRRLHCIDAATGQRLWSFDEAKAGYRTNPVVADGLVMLGNRDGWFYAVYAHGAANQGQLAWKVPTGGPVLQSAAHDAGIVYFASQDMHAYAVNTSNGTVAWKSQKLPGAGFHSWWPVIWKNLLVLTTRPNLRESQSPGILSLNAPDLAWGGTSQELINGVERDEIYPQQSGALGPLGTEPGDWVTGTTTMDATRAVDYFNKHPERRQQILLDRGTGQPHNYPAPFLNTGTKNGAHAPPIVSGFDQVLYQDQNLEYGGICRGQFTGWKQDTPFISVVANSTGAVDEPRIASGGGRFLYWALCCDRESGWIDVSTPRSAANHQGGILPSYEGLAAAAPGYDVMWFGLSTTHPRLYGSYGSPNGIYHNHTNDQNPFIPHQGRVFIHRSNAIFAASATGGAKKLELAKIEAAPADDAPPTFGVDELKQMLAQEVQKWVDTGHLHTGYFSGGQYGQAKINKEQFGVGDPYRREVRLNDYFETPGDNIWVLLRALPHLPSELQTQTRAFIQAEAAAMPLEGIVHIGWKDGQSRDWFDYPPEVEADRLTQGPGTAYLPAWRNVYALWKYAVEFGDAATIFAKIEGKLSTPPELVAENALVVNDAIAGHWAYLELEKLAGKPESTDVRSALDSMLAWRSTSFSKDQPFPLGSIIQRMSVSHNFVGLVPELGQYLRDNALSKVQEAMTEYEYVAPYWFVSRYEGSNNESTIQNLHDYYALFQSKAWILGQSREELVRHLDVPGFARGDVYYLHNLISAIEAPAAAEIVATPVIEPPGGGFPSAVSATITSATEGATIRYTLDGSEPAESSPAYQSAINVDRTLTIRARAYKPGMVSSGVISASFVIDSSIVPGSGGTSGSAGAGGGEDDAGACGCHTPGSGPEHEHAWMLALSVLLGLFVRARRTWDVV